MGAGGLVGALFSLPISVRPVQMLLPRRWRQQAPCWRIRLLPGPERKALYAHPLRDDHRLRRRPAGRLQPPAGRACRQRLSHGRPTHFDQPIPSKPLFGDPIVTAHSVLPPSNPMPCVPRCRRWQPCPRPRPPKRRPRAKAPGMKGCREPCCGPGGGHLGWTGRRRQAAPGCAQVRPCRSKATPMVEVATAEKRFATAARWNPPFAAAPGSCGGDGAG
jgi:hypothetical protein